ncbi:sensor histidine kinase [Jannaschia donghaensis]|uniref:histidine kinase n=1 Tax=Jannaschia donghaensis TaxID=420998 RepID=A0A0M6YM47_9RHOB|nr:ATP-binding protein [Jannaschia donghaensis]CTQ51441.1 Signal transduction histidine-protein kinase BarA [Jannaschia donghaensis]
MNLTRLTSMSNADLSKRIALSLVVSFLLLTTTVGITMVLMASSENHQVAEKTRALVRTAIEGYEASLSQFSVDYFNWTAVLEATERRDVEWLYENVGVAADLTDYDQDAIVISTPEGEALYGWTTGGGSVPRTDIFPAAVLSDLFKRLDAIDPNSKGVAIAYAEIDQSVWMFGATRMAPNEGPIGMLDTAMNRGVIAYRMDDDAIAPIAEMVLVEGLSLTTTPPRDVEMYPLFGSDGDPVAWMTWDRPAPGSDSLLRVLPAIIAVLGLVAAINYVAGRTVAGGARRIEKALVAARAADVAKGEFLTNMSHELRTPISGIAGVAEVLSLEDLTPDQQEMVQIIAASAHAQMALVEGLMNISRLEADREELAHAPFDPEREVRTVVGLLRPTAAEKEITLSYSAENVPMLMGDAGAFRQIVTNLIGNAVKFTDTGGVDVSLGFTITGDAAAVIVTIADTGPGIPKDQRSRIFERFAQIDGSSTRAKGGSGLGLAISQGLAALMGGTIRVVERPGPGSTFELRMTCDRAEMPMAA